MHFFDSTDPAVFWLDVTNVALGIVMLICCGVLAVAVGKQLLMMYSKASARATDDHAFNLPELGMTMADGGERCDAAPKDDRKRK